MGNGGEIDFVKGMSRDDINTSEECQAYCDNNERCVGYSYRDNSNNQQRRNRCFLHGPDLLDNTNQDKDWTDKDWTEINQSSNTTTIAHGNDVTGVVCVAKAGKNQLKNPPDS